MTGSVSPVRAVVVMGVSGAGKSVVGAGLAARLGWDFIDADHLHPAANVEKMAGGIPLTDDDRWPWLDVVGATLMRHPDGVVMACSALRRVYRDRIRAAAPETFFVELDGTPELLLSRISGRVGHFMPPSLLTSQLATLESLGDDERGARVSIDGTPEQVVGWAASAVS